MPRVGVTIEDRVCRALRRRQFPSCGGDKAEGKPDRRPDEACSWALANVGLSPSMARHGRLFEASAGAGRGRLREGGSKEAEPTIRILVGGTFLDKLSHTDIDDQTLVDETLWRHREAEVDVEPEPVTPDKPISWHCPDARTRASSR